MDKKCKKNVLTLTTYDVYNYGASLQAYALQQYISKLGCDVELINYQPKYLTRKYDYHWVNPESKMSKYALTRGVYRCLKYLQRQTTMRRKRAFDVFHNDFLLQGKCYHTHKEMIDNPPLADIYIVGSDQVWNTFYETGQDGTFYLDFVKSGKKVSYAASFSYTEISKEWKEKISIWLKDFEKIAVRECHGIDILKNMGLEGEWVLDPVFLLSINQWRSIMSTFKKKEPYLLVYDFENNLEIKRFCKQYAAEKGLRIYSVNDTYPRHYADKNFSSAGPREFLSLIYNCDAFVSNSFHGTAFSIIFEKPVFVFNRNRHKVNSRMESLTSLFGISDCMVKPQKDYSEYINMVFDFEHINTVRMHELEKSTAYLKELL